jgi:hypothetical protein
MKKKWTFEKLQEEALKYATRGEFQEKNSSPYVLAQRQGILDRICSHMVSGRNFGKDHPNFKWSYELLKAEALKYNTKKDFGDGNHQAYTVARKKDYWNEITAHMESGAPDINGENHPGFKWTQEKIQKEALKYNMRDDFFKFGKGAYGAARDRGILDEVCKHMKIAGGNSTAEDELVTFIKKRFPKAQKMRDRKVKIEGKPHVHGFDIDIYIPELRKGIEFDGTYWHSIPGLKRSREHWPKEDLKNYDKLKDRHFLSKGIEILHIKQKDWLENKELCIQRCLDFLSK